MSGSLQTELVKGHNIERSTVGQTFDICGPFTPGAWDRSHNDLKVSFTARPLDAFEPKRDVYVVDEIREAVTTTGISWRARD
jgi:hypothetical protein